MKLAIDVGYHDTGATAAGVLFENWNDARPHKEIRAKITEVAEYESGQFYKRELPCIAKLLRLVKVESDTIACQLYAMDRFDLRKQVPTTIVIKIAAFGSGTLDGAVKDRATKLVPPP